MSRFSMSLRPLLKSGDDDDVDIVVPSQWPCAQVVIEDLGRVLLEGVRFIVGIVGHFKHGVLDATNIGIVGGKFNYTSS